MPLNKKDSSKEKKPFIKANVFGSRRHDGKNPDSHESQPLLNTVKAFFRIAVPYWKTKDSLFGWLLLGLITIFTVATIYLAKCFNDWYKEFWDYVQGYNLDGFIGGIYMFTFLATIHVCTVVYRSYIISALTIRWRKWLTDFYLDRYLQNATYYSLQLTDKKTDNPDQRIAEDLKQFVSLTITLIISIITDLAMLVTFGIILWGLSKAVSFEIMGTEISLPDGYLFYLALFYTLAGTLITFIMGKPLVLLNFRQQRFEADFRFSLIRLRENAESVAVYKGEKEENKRFSSLFKDVVFNYVSLITKTKNLGFFTLGYMQTAVIFPIVVSAPMYFSKLLTIGDLMQINSAFSKVHDSMSTLISNFTALAEWKAVIDRLSLFEDSMRNTHNLVKPEIITDNNFIGVKNLSIFKPDNTQLATNLNITLQKGDSLLIQGHSGCGKSTLLRTMAGIWPYAKGEVQIPKDLKVLFLSQKPYMPLGTLRSSIYYPNPSTSSDSEINEYLDKVGLSYLKDNLDVIDQWSHVLSLGEQQRIAFMRILLLKPDVVFMDEITSALDEENENKLYSMLKEELAETIFISVGHRSTLKKHHNQVLNLENSNLVKNV